MKYRSSGGSIVGRVERGEEAVAAILQLISEHRGLFGSVIGLGAADDVEFSIYDVGEKQYHRTRIQEPMEMTSLTGLLGRMGGDPYAHLHATFGRADGSVVGGHLERALVSGTLEFVITALPFELDRHRDEATGLNVLSID